MINLERALHTLQGPLCFPPQKGMVNYMNNNLKLSENAIESILLESGISREKTDTCVRVFQHMAIFSDMERLEPVNKGMTNRLFFFAAGGKEYLLRVAGEGSEYLVDRMQEHWIYHKLQNRHITDPYVYMNPETGIKITEYIANARTCDSGNWEDVRRCMDHLARFHRLNVQGQVYFDLYEKLEEYQRVCQHDISEYFPD